MGVFDLKDYQLEQLKNWLLSMLPSWSEAEPELLAQYIITIVTGEGKSSKELEEKFLKQLAVFMADKTSEFVSLLFEALKKKSYADVVKASLGKKRAAKTQNKPTGNVESLDKLILDDKPEATESKKPRTENTMNTVASSNSSQKRRYSRFHNEKKSENKKETGKKNWPSFWNNQNSKHRKTNAPSNVGEKNDNPGKESKKVNVKRNYDPYTWRHSKTLYYYNRTKNVNRFASRSETMIVNRYDSGRTINRNMETDEHSRLCPRVEEKGVCGQGSNCPYAPNQSNVSDKSNDQHKMINSVDKNAFDNFDLQQLSANSANSGPVQISDNFNFANSSFPKMESASNNLSLDERIRELFPTLNGGCDAHAFNSKFFKNHNFELDDQTSLIIKQIPSHLNHVTNLINYFQGFGTIVYCEANFQNEPTSALVQFSDPSEATKAVRSTAAVFNNRFIKIFRANKLTDIISHSSSVNNPQLDSYKKKFPDVFNESIWQFPKIPKSPPKPTTGFHVGALKHSLEQINELVAYQDQFIKQLNEAPTVPEKKAIMDQLEFNLCKITELKQRIQKLYQE